MRRVAARVIGYCGAGIYEEFFFRLLMLTGLTLALQATGLNRRGSLIVAVVATSLLFAAAHYRIDLDSVRAATGPPDTANISHGLASSSAAPRERCSRCCTSIAALELPLDARLVRPDDRAAVVGARHRIVRLFEFRSSLHARVKRQNNRVLRGCESGFVDLAS